MCASRVLVLREFIVRLVHVDCESHLNCVILYNSRTAPRDCQIFAVQYLILCSVRRPPYAIKSHPKFRIRPQLYLKHGLVTILMYDLPYLGRSFHSTSTIMAFVFIHWCRTVLDLVWVDWVWAFHWEAVLLGYLPTDATLAGIEFRSTEEPEHHKLVSGRVY